MRITEHILAFTLGKALASGNQASAREILGPPRSPEARVALVGLDEMSRGEVRKLAINVDSAATASSSHGEQP